MKTKQKSKTNSARGLSDDSGFTLLEVMVVAAVLAGGLLIVASQYPFGAKQSNLRLLGMEIMSELRKTRDLALDKNDNVAFIFNAEERSYKITDTGKTSVLPEDVSFKMLAANEILARPQEGRIVFFGDSSSTGGTVTLAKGKAEFRINVDWLTGSVSLGRGG